MMIKEYKKISTYRDLDVYKMGMEGAMRIYVLSKKFPSDERYSLTDQIRRSKIGVRKHSGRVAKATISGCFYQSFKRFGNRSR